MTSAAMVCYIRAYIPDTRVNSVITSWAVSLTVTFVFVRNVIVGGHGDTSTKLYLVRLMTFVPGTTLHSVPYTSSILCECGELLGRIHKALQVSPSSCLNATKNSNAQSRC